MDDHWNPEWAFGHCFECVFDAPRFAEIPPPNLRKVIVWSRRMYESKMPHLKYPAGFYISIACSDDTPLVGETSNTLPLLFDDISNPDLVGAHKFVLFNSAHAHKVIRFIKDNEHKSFCVVHCAAGISRSAAIAEFIADLWRIPYEEFKKVNPGRFPNPHVSSLLREVYREHYCQ
jgi:hypothetical protein